MSDADNNNSATEEGTEGDASTPAPSSDGSGERSAAPSSATDDRPRSKVSLPSPGGRKPKTSSSGNSSEGSSSGPKISSATKRSSLSERLRKLAKKKEDTSEEKNQDHVGFVSSLTATPAPTAESKEHDDSEPESDSTPQASAGGDDAPSDDKHRQKRDTPDIVTDSPRQTDVEGEESDSAEPTDDDEEPEVAKTDRVTSLPFDVIADAHFNSDEDEEPSFDDATDRMESAVAMAREPDEEDEPSFDDSTDRINPSVVDTEPGSPTNADLDPTLGGPTDRISGSVVDDSMEEIAEAAMETDKTQTPLSAHTDRISDPEPAPAEFDHGDEPLPETGHLRGQQVSETHADLSGKSSPSRASTEPGTPLFDTTPQTLEPAEGVEAFDQPSPKDGDGSGHIATPEASTTSPPSNSASSAPSGKAESPTEDSDSEFEAGNTEIFQSAFDNDPISPRLSTLEGPAVGQDFLVNRLRNSVGRGTSNSISVADPAMSRMHFEIVQNPDHTYLIKDMRAVNGTSLNGVPIKEADLFHGDRIEAGQSTFQFVIPGDAPVDDRQRHLVPASTTDTVTAGDVDDLPASSPSPAGTSPSSGHRLLLIVTIAAAVLSIPLLGFLLYATIVDDDPAAEHAASPSAQELYFEGVEALRDHDLDRAEELFRQSRKIDPDFELADAQLERIDDERAVKSLIDEAAARADEEFDDDLIDELRAIPRDSRYYRDAQDKLSRVPHNEARLLFVDAQRAFDDGELERSAELVEKVRAIEPAHEGARQLEEAIADQTEESEEAEEAPEEDAIDDSARADRGDPPSPTTARPQPPTASEQDQESPLMDSPLTTGGDERSENDPDREQSTGINFMDGFNLYRADRLQEAIDHFQAIVDSSSGTIATRAERTADNIRNFKTSRSAADEAFQNGDYAVAADHFEQALRADESVVSGGSFQDTITERLAEALGRAGLRQLEQSDYSGAYSTLERAQNYRSAHPRVTALREEIDNTAQSLLDRATAKKESNPEEASRLFEVITTMVSPGSDLHQRARQHLGELN